MSSTVLYTVPSESNPNKSYEICQDDSNGGRLWCRVAGTNTGCTSWTVGWKRSGENHHTCKHQRQAIAALGMRVRVSGDFAYVTSLGLADTQGRSAMGSFNDAVNRARAGSPPARVPVRAAPAVPTRTARSAGPPPSLEQVRKAIPRATESDLITRGPRRRPDD